MARASNVQKVLTTFLIALVLLVTSSVSALAQETITGTIVSSSRNTVTLTTSPGQYQLFTFARNVRKPVSLPAGTQVRVVSSPGSEPGVRVASEITVTQAAAPNNEAVSPTVPADLQQIERDIEREARRYQIGVRGGVALDPELVLLGVQGQIGPFFRSGIFFRPNVDFGLGEVTAMFSLNGDVIYRLPFSSSQDRWSTYFGAGLGVNLIHQSFEGEDNGNRIDFGDFHSDSALNIIGGVRRRGGMFMELKTSVYAGPSPTLRMSVGYTF
jgi:hypothetical protein